MSETNDKKSTAEEDNGFKALQRQLLVDLTQEFATDFGHKKLCKSVAKMEKLGNKVNDLFIQSFDTNVDHILDDLQNQIKTNQSINENNLRNNALMSETIENIINKQIKIEKINESIVEKSLHLNELKAEDNGSQLMRQLLSESYSPIASQTVKTLLKNDRKD